MKFEITDKEARTILAALRNWNDPDFMLSESALFDDCPPLSLNEVKALCTRLEVLRHGAKRHEHMTSLHHSRKVI